MRVFSPQETKVRIHAGSGSTVCSAPASARVAEIICMEEMYTNIAFFRLQNGKGSSVCPQYRREGSEIHSAPTFRGCLLIFLVATLLSALDGLVWEAGRGL